MFELKIYFFNLCREIRKICCGLMEFVMYVWLFENFKVVVFYFYGL